MCESGHTPAVHRPVFSYPPESVISYSPEVKSKVLTATNKPSMIWTLTSSLSCSLIHLLSPPQHPPTPTAQLLPRILLLLQISLGHTLSSSICSKVMVDKSPSQPSLSTLFSFSLWDSPLPKVYLFVGIWGLQGQGFCSAHCHVQDQEQYVTHTKRSIDNRCWISGQ